MSRAKENTLYSTFSRGLITEASPLTFPENSTSDELNCVLFSKGNRTRRLGFEREEGGVKLSPHAGDSQNIAFNEYVWKNVGKIDGLNFLVQQIGTNLFFYNIIEGQSLTANQKGFTVNLANFFIPTPANVIASDQLISMVSGEGVLFVTGQYCEPFYVEYDEVGDTVIGVKITVRERDFTGVDGNLAVDEEPTVLSAEHHYNLRNQGWVDPKEPSSALAYSPFGFQLNIAVNTATGPIQDYFAAVGRYPGNNKQWWSGKDANEDFQPANLEKIFFGNTRAPRGHYILDVFNKDRSAVSGVGGLPVETSQTRPSSIAFYGGRVFYSHDTTIYFSRVLEDPKFAGECYSEADPTAENISDLIATDGGVIHIQNADKIVRIEELDNGIVIFALNGVWFIQSADTGFSATNYSVYKISSVGTESPWSVVNADNTIYWWSKTGIQALSQSVGQFGPVDGRFDTRNISDTTIKTYFDCISDDKKSRAKGKFDPASNTIQWLFASETLDVRWGYDTLLNLDLTLQAFYPWKVTATYPDTPILIGHFCHPEIIRAEDSKALNTRYGFLGYSFMYPTNGTYSNGYGYSISTEYVDWEFFDGNGQTYDSYALTGFEIKGDALRRKQTPTVGLFFRSTEENFILTPEGYVVDKPSSCFFSTRWDWATKQETYKWSREIQGYRPRRNRFVDEATLDADSGFAVVHTKNKVRGSGRAVQFRFFENRKGYTFDLLGWQVFYEGKTFV